MPENEPEKAPDVKAPVSYVVQKKKPAKLADLQAALAKK